MSEAMKPEFYEYSITPGYRVYRMDNEQDRRDFDDVIKREPKWTDINISKFVQLAEIGS